MQATRIWRDRNPRYGSLFYNISADDVSMLRGEKKNLVITNEVGLTFSETTPNELAGHGENRLDIIENVSEFEKQTILFL